MTPEMPAKSYSFRFTACTLLVLLVTKAGFGLTGAFGDRMVTNLLSYFQDAMLVLLSAGLLALTERVAPAWLKPFFRATFILWVALLTIMSLAYTPLIPDILRQPINLFSLDPAIITFSAGLFVSPLLLASAFGFIALLFGLPVVLAAHIRPASPWVWAACLLQTALFFGSLWQPVVSPLVYSLMEEAAALGRRTHNEYGIGTLEPSPDAAKGADYSFLFRPRPALPATASRYSRVVVLVMESVDYDALMRQFNEPGSEFPKRFDGHCVSYSNYHCLNLESYTGLLTLLNGVFIPYRAYGDDSSFSFVNDRDNLVRDMRGAGFTPWFVSSYGAWQARFVPDGPDWEGILLKDPEKNAGFVSVDTNHMERAVEDFAVLEDVVGLCRRPGKTFIMQEMVAGHSPIWTEETGIEPLAYYDRYFTRLYDRLAQEGLLEGTLLAITSDHGPRPRPTDPDSYHLPLLLISPDLTPGTEKGFLSHLDFAQILWAEISGGPPPREAERIFVVGSSVSFVYGMLGRDGTYALIDDHAFRVSTNMPITGVRPFQIEFEGYLSYFEERRKKAAPGPQAPLGDKIIIR